jgi:hypothetical protein
MSIAFLVIGLLLGAGVVYACTRGQLRAAEARTAADRRAAHEKLELLDRT